MRVHRIVLGLASLIACGIAIQAPALSEEYRGTMEQQLACTPDVWHEIPDANRIAACLRQNTPQLSSGCRAVFESNASSPKQAAPQQPAPGRRNEQPKSYQ
jgi:hypothetical protein